MQRFGAKWMTAALVALCAIGIDATAAPADTVPTVQGDAMNVPRAIQWDQRASGSGRDYRIFVSLPARPAPAAGYPVLYVLDGNAMFMTAVEAVRAYERRSDMPRDLATVVVGIGYPDGVDPGKERRKDLAPMRAPGPEHPRTPREHASDDAPGADAFLAFIEQDLKPRIATAAPVDGARQGIFGHSFAGLFLLHAMWRSPDAFQSWFVASPSVWFAGDRIKQEVAEMVAARKPGDPAMQVLVTVGEYEQALSPQARARDDAASVAADLDKRGQVDNARAVAEALGKGAGIQVRLDEIAGEDHGTVVPSAISRTVVAMLAPPLPVPPVPTAQAYLQLTPEQRYDLRLRVRDLPDNARIPWLTALKQTLHDGLTAEQVETLHAERNRMDKQHGTQPHLVNAPK